MDTLSEIIKITNNPDLKEAIESEIANCMMGQSNVDEKIVTENYLEGFLAVFLPYGTKEESDDLAGRAYTEGVNDGQHYKDEGKL